MTLSDATRVAVSNYLRVQALRYVSNTPIDLVKPYHKSLLPWVQWSPLSEHSFATRTGTWFPRIAQLVAMQYNAHVAVQHRVQGRSRAKPVIEDILRQFGSRGANRRVPNREADLKEVLARQSPGGEDDEWISDLYIRRHDGSELFFELKTPQPRKNDCQDVKRGILRIAAMKKGENAEAYAAFGYNPYSTDGGDATPYSWTIARQFLEIGADVLVGRAFWAAIGEQSTWDDVWAIARETGESIEAEARQVFTARQSGEVPDQGDVEETGEAE